MVKQMELNPKNINKRLNVIDIFCGAGGLSYGFYKNHNFNIICANDIEKDMTETYKSNHKDIPVYNMDIKNFNLALLKKELKYHLMTWM